MQNSLVRIALLCSGALALNGCSWFNSLGEHMPVIGERCENWQCFTSAGQAASDANKRRMQEQSAAPAPGVPAPQTPATGQTQPAAAPSATPSAYPAPNNPTGAYYQPGGSADGGTAAR